MVVALWGTGTIGGTLPLILGVAAAIFLVTSLVGWCPLYSVLGVSTLRGDGKRGSTAH